MLLVSGTGISTSGIAVCGSPRSSGRRGDARRLSAEPYAWLYGGTVAADHRRAMAQVESRMEPRNAS
jgi:hypothetical protein